MSVFGDNTPQQEMLCFARDVQDMYNLTTDELIIVLLNVFCYLIDPHDSRKEKILRKRRDDES